jgi:hypothetical protein
MPPSEPHAGATAVLVDELDARTLKRAYDSRQCRGITDIAASFNVSDSVSVDLSGFGEIPYAPI